MKNLFETKSRRKIALTVIGTMVISVFLGYSMNSESIIGIALNWLGGVGVGYIAGDSYRKSEV